MTERYIGLMSGTSMDGIDAVLVQIEGDALRVEAALCHPWPVDTARTLHELCTRATTKSTAWGRRQPGGPRICRRHPGPARQGGADSQGDSRHRQSRPDHTPPPSPRFYPADWQRGLLAPRPASTWWPIFAPWTWPSAVRGAPGARLPSGALCPPRRPAGGAEPRRHCQYLGAARPGRRGAGSGYMASIPAPPTPCSTAGIAATSPTVAAMMPVASGPPAASLSLRCWSSCWLTPSSPPRPQGTGREMFTLDWLDGELDGCAYAPADVQRTLQSLTCHSIARQLPAHSGAPARPELFVCGGGAHNARCWRSWLPCCPTGI